uniref:rho GTPase-activating protein 11A-like isoform X2 n=1 Tax=Myxine glutinosa TaxID=7769 RepID=UPI00358F08C1
MRRQPVTFEHNPRPCASFGGPNHVGVMDAGSRIVVQELKAYGIKVKVKSIGAAPQNGNNLVFHESPLTSLQEDSHVPSFVTKSCQYLMQHISMEGLFRKPGSFTRMKVLKERISRGEATVEGAVASDVACLLKRFFRDLPEPLLPQELHSALCQAQRLEILADRIYATLLLVRLLRPANLLLLRYLMVFLKAVAARSHENRMDEANLATVFAPNLMHLGRQEERPLVSVDEQMLRLQAKVVRTLIEHADSIGEVPQLGHGSTPSSSSALVAGTPRPLGTDGLRSVRRSCRRRSLNDVVSGAIGRLKPSLVNIMPTEVRNGTPRLSKRKRKESEEGLLNRSSSGKKRKNLVPGFLDYALSPNIPVTPDAWLGIPRENGPCSVDVLCSSEVRVLRSQENCMDVLSTPSLSKRTRLRLAFLARRHKKAQNGHRKKTPHIVAVEKVECSTQDARTNDKPRKSLRIRLNRLKNSMDQPVHKAKCELPLQGSMSNTTYAVEENVGRRLANCALHDGLDTPIRFLNPKAHQCGTSFCKRQGHQTQMMSAASLHPVGVTASFVDVTCGTDTSETFSKSASASVLRTDPESSPYVQHVSVSSTTPSKRCMQRAFLKCDCVDSICLLADQCNNEDSVASLCSCEIHFEKRKDTDSEMLKDIHVCYENLKEGNVESGEVIERLEVGGGVGDSSYKIDDSRCFLQDVESKMDSKEKRFDAVRIIDEAQHVVEKQEEEQQEHDVSSKPGPEFSKRNNTPDNIENDLNFQKKADCSLMNDLVSSISDLMKDESQVAVKQNDIIHKSTFKKRLLLFRNDGSNTVVGSATAMQVKSRVARRLSCENPRVCSKVAANIQIFDKLQEQQKLSVQSGDVSPCIELPIQERVRRIISLWESGQLQDSQAPDKTPVRRSGRIKGKGAAGVSNPAFLGMIKSHYKDEKSFSGRAGIVTRVPQTVAQLCTPEAAPKDIMEQCNASKTPISTLEDCTNQPQKHQPSKRYPNTLTPWKSDSAAQLMHHIEGKPLNGLFLN